MRNVQIAQLRQFNISEATNGFILEDYTNGPLHRMVFNNLFDLLQYLNKEYEDQIEIIPKVKK